jgi:LysM repeat protein
VLSPTPTVKAVVGGIAQIAAISANAATTTTALPTATVAVTPLPTPTSTPLVYQIKSGDTLVTIAAKYHVDVDALMAANQISGQDVYVIQPGEMLFIPTPAPTPTPATVRVEAPVLLAPPDNSNVGCATGGELIWQRVQFVKDSDKYVLHLGFVNGQDSAGQEKVTWVVDQSGPVTQTSWQLDTSLCDLAPAASGQQWRWWVEVIEDDNGDVTPVSPPSQIYRFVWK